MPESRGLVCCVLSSQHASNHLVCCARGSHDRLVHRARPISGRLAGLPADGATGRPADGYLFPIADTNADTDADTYANTGA